MNELDRIYNSMQDNFRTIFEKLDILQENQAFHAKDIEYIKEKMRESQEGKKENKKFLAAIIASCIALFGTLVNIFIR